MASSAVALHGYVLRSVALSRHIMPTATCEESQVTPLAGLRHVVHIHA